MTGSIPDDRVAAAGSCCTPGRSRPAAAPVPRRSRSGPTPGAAPGPDAARRLLARVGDRERRRCDALATRVPLPGGSFLMGTDNPDGFSADGEGPVREVTVSPFVCDAFCVTGYRFARFVAATGYVTEAELFGWSFVFHAHVPEAVADRYEVREVPGVAWWRGVPGACWAQPEGPGSTLDGRLDEPVAHVSWNDAVALARFERGRLPTEAEWELAARGGLEQAIYCWGDELEPGGEHRCNVWQGAFPDRDTAADGYAGRAPVDAFAPNGLGLHNAAGNVWEWCADWFATDHGTNRVDPRGPARGRGKVMKGGSFLCHHSYCNRYRVGARTANTPDSSAANCGVRLVFPPDSQEASP